MNSLIYTPTAASTFISVLGFEAVRKESKWITKPLHHGISRCTTRSKDLPNELDGRKHITVLSSVAAMLFHPSVCTTELYFVKSFASTRCL